MLSRTKKLLIRTLCEWHRLIVGRSAAGHYVTGDREPDLQTLVRICRVLNTTSNRLLGFDDGKAARKKTEREKLIDRLLAAAKMLEEGQLKLAVRQIEAIVDS